MGSVQLHPVPSLDCGLLTTLSLQGARMNNVLRKLHLDLTRAGEAALVGEDDRLDAVS